MSTTSTAPAPARAGTPSLTSLTPVFVRLKLSLLRNGLRQSSSRTAVYVTSLVLTLLFAALVLLGLIALRGNDHAAALAVLLITIVALGWAAMPLFFPSGDETLDPTRLAMLPLRPRPLIVALLFTSMIGIGPVFTLAVAVGSVIALAHGAAATVVGILAVLLVGLVCVALARAVATANVRLLTSRRGRDLAVLSGLFIAIGAQGVNLGVQKLTGPDGLGVLDPVATVVRWLPPASAVDAVDAASKGSYGRAAAGLALTALALVLLLWWWQRTLTTLMTAPDSSTLQAVEKDTARRSSERGPLRLLPAGRTGTVMLRSLRYAWRDPKTKMSWAAALGVGLLLPIVTGVQGNGSVYSACWAAGLLGIQMYNQFGQDTSAFWMVAQTIAAPRDAYVELRARALTIALVAVPYVTAVVIGAAAVLHQWSEFPEAYGIALALLGALVGTGALSSALAPYSIPSDGRKNVAPGQTGIASLSIMGGMLVGGLLAAPVLGLTIALHVTDAHGLLWLVLPVGAAYGLAAAYAGLRIAAPRVANRLPEILAAVSKG
ncbi:transporter [Streptomyces sp. NPDC050610]|uniref:transporter n=1 Tax=Streptomyces sp. NPDC050610 TaxID=3157097 RepID=UPI0034300509